MESTNIWLLLIIGLPIGLASYFYQKNKVAEYINEKYGEVQELSIKWTLFGPWAPGNDNIKFRVEFRDQNGNLKTLFAVTSFFGSVYIRDE